jgi:hypothetical protein
MNWIEKAAAGLAVAVTLTTRASDDFPTNNPYAHIATRNVFGLQPPSSPGLPAVADVAPLPQIALKGIMTVFGPRTALFTVIEPLSPEHPASNKSYTLNEGEQSDGIEVKQVNEKEGMVTFDNHGTIQEIKLGKQSDGPPPREFHHPFR